MHTTATTFGLSQQSGPSNPDTPHKDVYACVADAGWITGHTYIVSDHLLCCIMHNTTVLVELTISAKSLGIRSTPQWFFDLYVRVDAHVSGLWSILGYGPAS